MRVGVLVHTGNVNVPLVRVGPYGASHLQAPVSEPRPASMPYRMYEYTYGRHRVVHRASCVEHRGISLCMYALML